jgi:hypothetical protein
MPLLIDCLALAYPPCSAAKAQLALDEKLEMEGSKCGREKTRRVVMALLLKRARLKMSRLRAFIVSDNKGAAGTDTHHSISKKFCDSRGLIDSIAHDIIHRQWSDFIVLIGSFSSGLLLDDPYVRQLSVLVSGIRRYRVIYNDILYASDFAELYLEVLSVIKPARVPWVCYGLSENGIVVRLPVEEWRLSKIEENCNSKISATEPLAPRDLVPLFPCNHPPFCTTHCGSL